MAFPTTPTDGQTTVVNGITYVYSLASNSWTRQSTGFVTVSASGNITGGNILTGGQVSATGNITGSYYFGNGSQLTGVAASSAGFPVSAGTTNFSAASGGNIYATVGGTANVLTIATTGIYTAGLSSVTGNITGGNISATNHTGTTVSVTGTVTAASTVGGVITGSSSSVTGTQTAASTVGGVITGSSASVSGGVTAASVAGGVITGTSASLSGNVTGGNVLTGGLISVTGNITGGNVLGTTGVYKGGVIVLNANDTVDGGTY